MRLIKIVAIAIAVLVAFTLVTVACEIALKLTSNGSPPSRDPIVEAGRDFWAEAKPIIQRQIEGVGDPLAALLVEVGPQVRAGEPSSMQRWVVALREARPMLAEAFLELSRLRPPPGPAARWHQAQLTAWGMRLDSIDILISNWSDSLRGFVGTAAERERGSSLWDQSMLAGQQADRLQADLVEWLAGGVGRGTLPPVPTQPAAAGPEPSATPENLALKVYVQRAQSIMGRRADTQEAASQAVGALRAAATSDFMTPVWSRPALLSSLTEEQIHDYFFGTSELPPEWQQALADTVARLRSVLDAARAEEVELGRLVVPVEAQPVHGLLIRSVWKQGMAWQSLLDYCILVLSREVRWDLSQVDELERLLLEARGDRLEAELELGRLVGMPGGQGVPQAAQNTGPPPGFVVEQQLDVDLDGDGDSERVQVSVKEAGTRQAEARLDVFTPAGSGAWLKILEQEHGPVWDCGLRPLAEASLTDDYRKQAVFSLTCGNGGFLYYWVIAYEGGSSAYILRESDGLAQGQIELEPGGIGEWDGGRLTLFHWNGREFVGQRVTPTPIASGRVVRYWIEPADSSDGRCAVRVEDNQEIRLHMGERLQLLRSDLSDCSERLFAAPVLEWSDQHGVLQAVGVGESVVSIVPYDWDSALELRVVVTQ